MQRCAFTPYEGKKPYIFVSYAHKDSDRVFPILEELDRRGYRVWYDDGIAPGSEWPENIAQHLDGCSLTLAFVSPSSIASPNCRREVTFALSKHKPFLGILLEPTEMSLGMEMQLSAQQCIMKYTYPDEQSFFSKICSCPDLQPCLGQPKPIPQPAPMPAPAPVVAPAPVSVPKQASAPKPVPMPREKKPLDKKLLAIIGGAVAAVAVVAIVLVIALSGGNKPDPNLDNSKPSNGSTPSETVTNKFEMAFTDQTVTAEDIATINANTKLESLEFHNCQFQEGILEELTLPVTLKKLIIRGCEGVTQLQSLASLQNLEVLELSNSSITNDTLPELTIPTLKELNISVNEDFSALSLFAGCTGLERIDFSNTIVDNVNTLSALEQLTYINGSHTEVADISPLADLANILELRFANCCISTIDKSFHTLYLKTLDLSCNSLTDLIAFQNCAVLESVYLGFNQLETAYPISKCAMFLTVLDFSGNMKMDKNDLYFLDEAINLKELYIDGLSMFDLDDLHNLTKLERLSAMDCSISDLTGLENTVGTLKYLNLSSNSLDDISILAGLQGNGLYLDLSFNFYVTDLSLLSSSAQYAVLNITNERLDLSTIPALQIDTLILAYAKDAEKNGWLQTNPAGAYVVIDCPMDKVVVMETMLGRGNVQFMEEIEDYVNFLGSLGVDVRYMEAAIKSY